MALLAIFWRSKNDVGRPTVRRPDGVDSSDIALPEIGVRQVIEAPFAIRFQNGDPRAALMPEGAA